VTNHHVEYCLALALERTGVLLHAVCVMSNHWHGVVTDPDARLPEFLEIFHKLLAKAQNASLGRWENFWSSDKTSVLLLVSESDVLDKMAYTLANPTAAGLVKAPHEWPGVLRRFGEHSEVDMPDAFFDDDGELPDSVDLELTRPTVYASLSDSQLQACVEEAVGKRVKQAREDMVLRRLPFLGRNAVLRQSFSAAPKTSAPRRNPSPRIAAKSTPARVQAIRRILAFVREYRAARNEWRTGDRSAVFPAGTYALRIHACVTCAPALPT
jgi:REP element-mobilizing transposase RayT